jgi:hypothetical protein
MKERKGNTTKRALLSALLLTIIFSSFRSAPAVYSSRHNRSFSTGEKLNYRVHVGFINAGEGTLLINDEIESINNRACYKIDVFGKTVGVFDFFIRVRDHWGTYLDTVSIIPHKFFQQIEEGKFRKHEVIEFDHIADTAVVKRPDKDDYSDEFFNIPHQPQDLISGYYYIRTLDYNKVREGQIIALKAFYDKTVYDFKVKFLGREVIKTKLGTVKTLVFAPIMPKNDLFEEGKESIKIWLSDDDNKIPLKIWAKMWVGAVEIDINNAENLRSPLAVVNK